jgi:hypothetical protein
MNSPLRRRVSEASLVCLAAGLCLAQEPVFKNPFPSEGPMPTFGVTVVDSLGLQGQVYLIREGSDSLPNFKKLKPVGTIYTRNLNISPRGFTEGFPGVTDRFEWFAIDYTGKFWIEKPGKYIFALLSDDGSKLYIDKKEVIDNDGVHSAQVKTEKVKLKGGLHEIRVSYFQGPRTELALMLGIAEEGDTEFKLFDTRQFLPPGTKIEPK